MRITSSHEPIKLACSHTLPCVPGDTLHGHTYTVQVWVSCDAALITDTRPWVMDNTKLISIVRGGVFDKLDHSHLNDTIPVSTTEMLCKWAWPRIECLLDDDVDLEAVEFCEDDNPCRLTRQ